MYMYLILAKLDYFVALVVLETILLCMYICGLNVVPGEGFAIQLR